MPTAKKISDLPASAGLTAATLFEISKALVSEKLDASQLRTFIGAQLYTGAAPPAAPADPTLPALFYPNGGGSLLQWDTVGLAWV